MKIEITREDYELLSMLLSKEEVGTRVEIHHCRTREFKELLKKREQQCMACWKGWTRHFLRQQPLLKQHVP